MSFTIIRCIGGGSWWATSDQGGPGWSTEPCGQITRTTNPELVLADIQNRCPNCEGDVEAVEETTQ